MQEITRNTEEVMKRGLEYFQTELDGVQAGRANTSLIEGVKVDAYGQEMTMKQVGTISTPDARTLQVQVWDQALVTAVEKAIRDDSSLGLSPATDGNMVRMQIPAMTEERRQLLVKGLSEKLEAANVTLRNARHDGLKKAKSAKEDGSMPEDEYFKTEKALDELTREYQSRAQQIFETKKQEVLTV
ncbi:ribosome recycling factor [bacterium]|nr:MAG: ribosome recycling factor [bacterium]